MWVANEFMSTTIVCFLMKNEKSGRTLPSMSTAIVCFLMKYEKSGRRLSRREGHYKKYYTEEDVKMLIV